MPITSERTPMSQAKGALSEGLHRLSFSYMKSRDEARSFPAELAAPTHGQVPLAALMVWEWKSMVVQRQHKLIQTLVWWTKNSQHIVQCT